MVIGATLVAMVAGFEGYRQQAYVPIPGDVPTIGFGHTLNVEMGDTITKERALALLQEDIDEHADAVRECVLAPIFDYEFRAYSSLAFNIGKSAFCNSTVARRANAEDYQGACEAIKMWNKSGGRVVEGLVNRRELEYRHCLGEDVELPGAA